MTNSADLDQLASSVQKPMIWIYIVCKGRVYPGSAGQGLIGYLIISFPVIFKSLSALGSN